MMKRTLCWRALTLSFVLLFGMTSAGLAQNKNTPAAKKAQKNQANVNIRSAEKALIMGKPTQAIRLAKQSMATTTATAKHHRIIGLSHFQLDQKKQGCFHLEEALKFQTKNKQAIQRYMKKHNCALFKPTKKPSF